jgi:hypothetical protein
LRGEVVDTAENGGDHFWSPLDLREGGGMNFIKRILSSLISAGRGGALAAPARRLRAVRGGGGELDAQRDQLEQSLCR